MIKIEIVPGFICSLNPKIIAKHVNKTIIKLNTDSIFITSEIAFQGSGMNKPFQIAFGM
ncbi:MAG: hypothetical protein H7329_00965 [Opitutaceae bacterium]|nr:hypothetical protein [Cytophagales bacterium]